MSVKDGKDYLYLIWKSEQSRKQYIVGQLTKNSQYEFRYSEEVQLAIDDGYMLLKRSGARLPIDNLEFIDPILNTNENVTRIFFMAGVRHYLNCSGNDCLDAVEITRGDEVFLQREPANKYDENAVQMLDASAKVLGYIPRYYSKGVSGLLAEGKKIVCHIYNVDKNKNCNECVKVIMDMRHLEGATNYENQLCDIGRVPLIRKFIRLQKPERIGRQRRLAAGEDWPPERIGRRRGLAAREDWLAESRTD